ncbi:siderophore-interacting protein [Luteococcus sp.]|uniref:siderophore-interacting protein n=1 Tax=Luteococcus sp. TaxID=1969402 RepID=UPI003736610E
MPQTPFRQFRTTVVGATWLSPTFRRVTLGNEALSRMGDVGLDQRAKLVLPLPGDDPFGHFPADDGHWFHNWRGLPQHERNPIRTVTLRSVRRRARELDVDIAVHSRVGPLSRWALDCRPGDPVLVIGPDATHPEAASCGIEWRPGPAREVLLAGDETAAPAICSILESLPRSTTGRAWIEVPSVGDRLEVDSPDGVEVTWLARHESPAGDELLEALTGTVRRVHDLDDAQLWEIGGNPGEAFAWVAGEASMVRGLRRHLVATGWDMESVALMGYWRRGRSEA